MNPNQLIKEIETTYDVHKISSRGLPVWQYIRNLLYNQIVFPQQNSSNRIKSFYYLMKN